MNNTYKDLLQMVDNPKLMLGHFLCENLVEDFKAPKDNDMGIRVYVGENLITKPHDLNVVLTDWVRRWVEQILDKNYNFSNFKQSVEDEAKALTKKRTDIFLDELDNLRDVMQAKLNDAFSTMEFLDFDVYASNKEKDQRIKELEARIKELEAQNNAT